MRTCKWSSSLSLRLGLRVSLPLDWKIKLIKRFQLNVELGMLRLGAVIPLKWQINFNKFHLRLKSAQGAQGRGTRPQAKRCCRSWCSCCCFIKLLHADKSVNWIENPIKTSILRKLCAFDKVQVHKWPTCGRVGFVAHVDASATARLEQLLHFSPTLPQTSCSFCATPHPPHGCKFNNEFMWAPLTTLKRTIS